MNELYDTRSCPVCGSTETHDLHSHKNDRFLHNIGEGEVFFKVCGQCGLSYQNPLFKQSVLTQYYEEQARGNESLTEPGEAYFADRQLGNDNRFAYIKSKIPSLFERDKPKVLDIGCAAGMLLDRFKDGGFETFGVEPTIGYAKFAKERSGHNVLQGLFDEDKFKDEKFDLIVMSHVLEHIFEPRSLLKLLTCRLKPDGFVYIEVPNFNNIIDGAPMEGLFNGPHLQMYSLYSLEKQVAPFMDQVISIEENNDAGCTGSVRIIGQGPLVEPRQQEYQGGIEESRRARKVVKKHKITRKVKDTLRPIKRSLFGGKN